MLRWLALAMLAACSAPRKAAHPDAASSRPPTPTPPDAGIDAPALFDFTETYSPGTQDTGHWMLTTNTTRPRSIRTSGGNPGGYLHAELTTTVPTWSTMSTRYEPGTSDSLKRDSVFVGDYDAAGITHLTVDLDVLQAGTWGSDRALTLELRSWDAQAALPGLVADCSLPEIAVPPAGWTHYDFAIAAHSTTIPTGWTLVHGDGSPATDADWATLMHEIDYVGLGYGKPGVGYPSSSWTLGLDNIHITAQ
jgi:hypothetical protein